MKWFRLDLPPEKVHQLVAELEQLIALDLSHAGLAAPLATGLIGVSAYLAQDFVAAESLDVVIRDSGPARPADTMRVAAQLASAVDAAAALQVVHGALHPRDVLLTADDARMTGYGVARALERVGVSPPIRRPYTAPERIAGLTWDHRADLFSVAALVYEYLTGRRVGGVGADAVGTIEIPGADGEALARVFARALAGNPLERFETGHAFVGALEDAFNVKAVVPPPVKRTRHTPRRTEAVSTPPPAIEIDSAPLFAAAPAAGDFDWHLERDAIEHPGIERDRVPLHLDDMPLGESFEEPTIQLDRADDNPALHVDTPVRAALREDPLHAPYDAFDAHLAPGPHDDPPDLHLATAAPHDEPELTHAAPDAHVASDLHLGHAESQAGQDEWPLSPAGVAAAPEEWHLEPEEAHAEPDWSHGAAPEPSPSAPAVELEYAMPKRRRAGDLAPPPAEPSRFALDGVWPLALALIVGVAIGFGMALVLVGGNAQVPADEVAAARPVAPPVAVTEEPIVPEGARPPAAPALASVASASAAPPAAAPAAAVTSLPPGIASPASAGPTGDAAPVPPVVHEPTAIAPPPARAAAPTTGRLLVRSTPAGASVMLDGKSAGVTPLTVPDLSRGRHTVRVARDGYVTEERTITIAAGDSSPTLTVALARLAAERRATPPAPSRPAAPRAATPSRGATAPRATANAPRPATAPSRPAETTATTAGLLVESRPTGARVTLDGRVVGVTPLTLNTVGVGEHAISIERPGYRPWASSVTVAAGTRNRVAASLEQ